MCSRPLETRSRPRFLAATLATLPSMSLFPKAPFDLSVLPIYVTRAPAAPSSPLPSRLCLDHSHCPVLVPATLAALPSTRAIPIRDVFYVAFPKSSIRPVGLPVYVTQLPSAPFAEIANNLKRSQV